jgi:hypothetical protein
MTMAIPAKQRWIVYAIAFVLALAAVSWAGGQDRADSRNAGAQSPPPERPARDAAADHAQADAIPEVRLDQLGKRAMQAPAGDPFQPQSWDPPVERTIKRALPPPRPQAPALPFAYLGKMMDGETMTVFLAKQDRNYIVRAGDTLDGDYRVAKVDNDGLELVYLPLGVKQTLQFGATPAAAPSAKPRKPQSNDDDDEDE